MRLGVGRCGDSIDDDLALVGSDLAEKEIYCGVHSGAHQHGEGTDCGANDKFALILENGLKFSDQITASTEAAGEEKPLAVTKRLDGDHNEDYIIVNYVEGTTFSQGAFADTLRESFPDKDDKNLAQAFVVDAWRVVELAKASVPEDEFETAMYAGVAYQVATAATLTDGTLKMFAYTQA